MIDRRRFVVCALALCGCGAAEGPVAATPAATPRPPAVPDLPANPPSIEPVTLDDAAWQQRLEPQAYDVLRHEGTEMAFTGAYWDEHRSGSYECAGCGLALFSSADKFDSGTGWPSFTQPVAGHVSLDVDGSFGMERTKVSCARCAGHLGHVFDDGPAPTGKRYCMNSAALYFVAA